MDVGKNIIGIEMNLSSFIWWKDLRNIEGEEKPRMIMRLL